MDFQYQSESLSFSNEHTSQDKRKPMSTTVVPLSLMLFICILILYSKYKFINPGFKGDIVFMLVSEI